MRELLDILLDGHDLDATQSQDLLSHLTSEEVPAAAKGAALAALRVKGETPEEVSGMAMAMRGLATAVNAPEHLRVVDTCGTGGDGSDSFNISTTTALLLAAAGIPVVKHGNRSVSSRCGSADVIEALGISLATGPEEARQQLIDTSFTFLFAPAFHAATAAVVPVRRALGARTVFNVLGPLANPAQPRHQLVGAYSTEAARLMARALSQMPIERCFVVHGEPGWDEATGCGTFLKIEVLPGSVTETTVDPLLTYGVARCQPEDLAGGDIAHNARLIREVFSGSHGPKRDAVLLNAALVMELLDPKLTSMDAMAAAADVIDSGRATWFLERLSTVRE